MKAITVGIILLALAAMLLTASWASAQAPGPGATPTPTPTPTPWWQSDKAPWLIAAILGVLSFTLGTLAKPTLERWGKAIDLWLQGLGFGFEKRYLEALVGEHCKIKLVGVRGRAGVIPPKLKDVYISLQVGSPGESETQAQSDALNVGEALQKYRKLVVLGEPGAGKSTLLSYLVLIFCGDVPTGRLGLNEKRLPIYIRLQDCVDGEQSICQMLTTPRPETRPSSSEGDQPTPQKPHRPPVLPVSQCPPGFFEGRLQRGQCIVLLDGLDEVVDEKQREAAAHKIRQMVGDYPDNRYVVTCRTAGWDPNLPIGDFDVLKIRDLNPAQVAHFIHDWYKAVLTLEQTAGKNQKEEDQARQKAAEEAQSKAKALVTALENNEGLARISKNPLILSLIALVHRNKTELPKKRAEVYQDCLAVLLEQWDKDAHGLEIPNAPSSADRLAIAQTIAWDFQVNERNEANLDELEKLIAPILQECQCKVEPDECLKKQMVERSGLLVERANGRYSFAHRTLQEYLAAKSMQETDEQDELFAHLGQEPWREVTLLYVGMAGKPKATAVAEEILSRPDDATCNLTLLAGQCLAEDVRVEESARQKCLGRLVAAFRSTADPLLFARLGAILAAIGGQDVARYFEQALRDKDARVRRVAAESLGTLGKRIAPARVASALLIALKDSQAAVRQAAADSLGRLGHASPEVNVALDAVCRQDDDPAARAGAVGALVRLGHGPEFNLVRIPAGEFLMGSEEYDDEKPPHKVYLDEFYIGRHPVTNANFGRFVQAGGYSQKQWWTEAGWQWKGERTGPERYGGAFDRPDHPAVGVRWHEAMAYAAWAGMRLPTEAEWEKAARGTDGRRWPWGETFDSNRCNTSESQRGPQGFLRKTFAAFRRASACGGSTTPIGQYSPQGDSPYGVADMAGNVWEWCHSLYKDYGGEPRVVRGGAWHDNQGDARCASRGALRELDDFADYCVGVRVVLSPNRF